MQKRFVAIFLAVVMVVALLAGCGGESKSGGGKEDNKPTITVGSKEFTEQVILGNMLALLLEKNGYPVDKKLGLGGTMVVAKALEKGEIDVYAEYTGTGLVAILKENVISNPDECYQFVKEAYKEKYNLVWMDRFGLNNTYTLTMKAGKAQELGIDSISDLTGKSKKMVFGTDQEFLSRPDGYPALAKHYGFEFEQKNIKAMDAGLVYQAVDTGQVDIIMAFATDGRIPKLGLINLKDDKNFFPVYDAAPVVRGELLEEHPEIADILNQLGDRISDEQMQLLNAQVDMDGKDPAQVAKDFLTAEGLY